MRTVLSPDFLGGPPEAGIEKIRTRLGVFGSLDPDKIQVGPSSTWGPRSLKNSLSFARTGILGQPDTGGIQESNDFGDAVSTVLKDVGFEVVPQVGVARFHIDLAVKHPINKGAYLLGIECDGARCHSDKSARDRDRLGQEILERTREHQRQGQTKGSQK